MIKKLCFFESLILQFVFSSSKIRKSDMHKINTIMSYIRVRTKSKRKHTTGYQQHEYRYIYYDDALLKPIGSI